MPEPKANLHCWAAVAVLEKHLDKLPHPAGTVRLVQFAHRSPGLLTYLRRTCEALVLLLESNGILLHNGWSEVVSNLEREGYRITQPTAESPSTSTTGPNT